MTLELTYSFRSTIKLAGVVVPFFVFIGFEEPISRSDTASILAKSFSDLLIFCLAVIAEPYADPFVFFGCYVALAIHIVCHRGSERTYR